MYAPFELEMPGDLAGALDVLAAGRDAKTVPIAVGTNLIVDMRAKRERPDRSGRSDTRRRSSGTTHTTRCCRLRPDPVRRRRTIPSCPVAESRA